MNKTPVSKNIMVATRQPHFMQSLDLYHRNKSLKYFPILKANIDRKNKNPNKAFSYMRESNIQNEIEHHYLSSSSLQHFICSKQTLRSKTQTKEIVRKRGKGCFDEQRNYEIIFGGWILCATIIIIVVVLSTTVSKLNESLK